MDLKVISKTHKFATHNLIFFVEINTTPNPWTGLKMTKLISQNLVFFNNLLPNNPMMITCYLN